MTRVSTDMMRRIAVVTARLIFLERMLIPAPAPAFAWSPSRRWDGSHRHENAPNAATGHRPELFAMVNVGNGARYAEFRCALKLGRSTAPLVNLITLSQLPCRVVSNKLELR